MPQHGIEFEALSFRGVRGKGLKTLLLGPFALARRLHRRAFASFAAAGPMSCWDFGGYVVVPGRADGRRGRPAARHPRLERGRGTRQSRARLRRRSRAAGLSEVDAGSSRADERVGRQSVARRHRGPWRRPRRVSPAATGPLRLLVVGGSLGAQALNDRVPAALARLAPDRRPRVVHQAGAQAHRRAAAAYAARGVEAECVPFIDDMARALRRGGSRRLPRRRADRRRARRGRRRRADRAAARRDRRRAERQRASPGRRRRGDRRGRRANSRRTARRSAGRTRPRAAAGDGDRRTSAGAVPMRRDAWPRCASPKGRSHEAQGQARAFRRHRRRRA